MADLKFVDAIVKHAALYNNGHDDTFLPPSSAGNPFSHTHRGLAEVKNETSHPTTRTSLLCYNT